MTTKTCPHCKGKGFYEAVNILREVVECVCIICNGTGKVNDDETKSS